jgi:hypothetical protein
MHPISRRAVLALAAGASLGAPLRSRAEDESFSGERTDETVVLRAPDGKPIVRYVREPLPEERRPAIEGAGFSHPIHTPGGVLVTDLAPEDHPHHRGVFCAWVRVEGEKVGDWWGWGAKAPKEGRLILNREAELTEQAVDRVTLRLINSWRADEATVLRERLEITARSAFGAYVLDYDYKFTVPTRKDVVIAQSPFGGFCYRARSRGKLEVSGPGGKLDLPDAVFDQATRNWPASRWYDFTYYGPNDAVSGVAVMDHPKNPPTTWCVHRGIHMLNPCITAESPVTIPFGEPLYLRYRLVAHDGDATNVDLKSIYETYTSVA